jgi:hypothetical protein
LDVDRFRSDLYSLTERACKGDSAEVKSKVNAVADVLVGLYLRNKVKINHSALELVCARSLILDGYEVKVEQEVDERLVCDVRGRRGESTLIVEIETGFIPPEEALRPTTFVRSRIASKIARYSRFADKFVLGTTPSYVLDFPQLFVKPPRFRTEVEVAGVKALTDIYYDNPPLARDELLYAKLHSVFIIDVDTASVRELDPETYLQNAKGFGMGGSGG